jgi:ssDNA-binding replication factor A large subunit
MCCLSHEQATYEYLNDKLPNVGDFVKTVDGKKGEVQSVNVLRQKVKIVVTLDDNTKEVEEYRIEDLRFKPKKKKSHDRDENDAELKKLEALERKEGKMEKLS